MPFGFLLRGLVFGGLVLFVSTGWAAPTVVVSATEGIPLTIDLRTNLSGMTDPVVTISGGPSFGSAQVSANTIVSYTPNLGFSGSDTISYQVSDSLGATDSGDVVVNVGSQQYQGNTARDALERVFRSACSPDAVDPPAELCGLWDPIANTTEDVRELLDSLSPEDIAAQLQLSSELLLDQAASISKRLAALRKAMKHTVSGQLSMRGNDHELARQNQSGGAASADSILPGSRLSWFLDNSNRSGGQDATLREDGFDYISNSVNLGLDLTLGNSGVIGTSFGIGKSDLELVANSGRLSSSGISNALYGSFYMTPATYLDVVINNSYHELNADRRVLFGALIDDVVKSQTYAWTSALNVSVGAEKTWGNITVSLDNSLSYVKSKIEGYTETSSTNSNPFVLSIDQRDVEQTQYNLVLRTMIADSYSWGVWNHQIDLTYNRLFKEDAEVINGHYVVDPDNMNFKFSSDREDVSFGQLAYGANFVIPGGTMIYVRLNGTLAKENQWGLGSNMGLRMEF